MLSLAELRENTGTGGCTLEATERAVERLAFLHSDFCHSVFPPFAVPITFLPTVPRDSPKVTLKLYTIFPRLSRVFSKKRKKYEKNDFFVKKSLLFSAVSAKMKIKTSALRRKEKK